MNAYELADWIKETNFYENIDDHFINDTMDKVEIMLRQQADRLKKYELRNTVQCDRIAILEAQNKQQADRIDKLMTIAEDYQMLIVKLKENSHPVKQLSDEEIDNIGRQHLTDGDGAIEFARAIIKEITE